MGSTASILPAAAPGFAPDVVCVGAGGTTKDAPQAAAGRTTKDVPQEAAGRTKELLLRGGGGGATEALHILKGGQATWVDHPLAAEGATIDPLLRGRPRWIRADVTGPKTDSVQTVDSNHLCCIICNTRIRSSGRKAFSDQGGLGVFTRQIGTAPRWH
mmetsp:Transcript_4335/g.12138  ORF Transcript_4335/g.12138 Transcript_4335/m.12138 type:complete len:158 (+) Transcript_4335:475-948(+)